MNNRQVSLLNAQLFIAFILAITLLTSFLLTYDEKLKLLNKKRLFTDQNSHYTNLLNRILFLLILIYNLYINYQQYELEKQKRSDLAPFRQQIYASILNTIAAVIILYVVYETLNTNDDIAPIDNTI